MFSMRVEGGAELVGKLNALPSALSRPVVVEALKQSAEPIRRAMAQRAPRSALSHPHIADNISVSTARNQGKDEPAVAVGPQKDFAHRGYWLEFGTVKMSARPFVRPAFDEKAGPAVTTVGNELWNALERSTRGRSTGGGLL
jgi:HK97 gp10 family phage protein